MARKRASWNWECSCAVNKNGLPVCSCISSGKAYPIFVYTTWLDHFHFRVDIVKGKQGNQNAPGYGPFAKPWKSYKIKGFSSKAGVVTDALRRTRKWLKEGH